MIEFRLHFADTFPSILCYLMNEKLLERKIIKGFFFLILYVQFFEHQFSVPIITLLL